MKCLGLVTGPDSNGVATGTPVAVIIARMKQRTEEDAESARDHGRVRARVKCVRRAGERFTRPGPRPRPRSIGIACL